VANNYPLSLALCASALLVSLHCLFWSGSVVPVGLILLATLVSASEWTDSYSSVGFVASASVVVALGIIAVTGTAAMAFHMLAGSVAAIGATGVWLQS